MEGGAVEERGAGEGRKKGGREREERIERGEGEREKGRERES